MAMAQRAWWGLVGLVLCTVVMRALCHLVKLIILLAMGLLALYLFTRLRQQVTKLTRPTRHIQSSALMYDQPNPVDLEGELKTWLCGDNGCGQWATRLLSLDKVGCARKYLCHLGARPRSNLTNLQHDLLPVVGALKGEENGSEWETALKRGYSVLLDRKYYSDNNKSNSSTSSSNSDRENNRNRKKTGCSAWYPRCSFSSVQLDRIVKNFDSFSRRFKQAS